MLKNQAAFLIGQQVLEIRECEMPVVSDTDVLIEVRHIGICGSDMHIFEDPYHAVKDIQLPVILGHECAGRVEAVGKKVTGLAPGDLVALEPGVPCGVCEYCRSGRYNLCPDVRFLGARPWLGGAFSKYVCHPAKWTYKLPDTMDTIEGALIEPLAVGMHAANRSGIKLGQNALILGAGCIGLMTLEACLARGVQKITIADLHSNRLTMAEKIGAENTICSSREDLISRGMEITDRNGFDVIFESSGSKAVAALAPALVKRGGKIVMVGNIFGETPFNFFQTNAKEIDIIGVFRYCNLFPTAIDLCRRKQVDTKPIVTNYFHFSEIQNALEYAINQKQAAIKTVINM